MGNTQKLLKFDLEYNTSRTIIYLKYYSFNYTNTCILPDFNVILVGIYTKYLGDSYRFD